MATFLTTHGTAFQIEQIIARAKTKLVLISPYLQLSQTLFERLRDADRNRVRITIVYGKSSLSRDQERALAELKNLSLYFLENLHAKCYFNEVQMVITSMNMYEFSEKNNREMGVLVESSDKSPRPRGHHQAPREGDPGFCIRCGKRIDYEPELPYCEACGAIWAQYENPNYREEVCHSCGRGAETSMNRPLCYRCYRDEGY